MMQHTTPYFVAPIKKLGLLALSAILAATLMPFAPSAYGDEISDKKAEAASVLANLNAMQGELDRLSVAYGEALAAQTQAEQERDAAHAKVAAINGEMELLQTRLSNRAREMYRSGGISYVDTLLGAKTFEEFVNNIELFNRMNSYDASLVQDRKVLRKEAQKQAAIFNGQAALAAQKATEAAAAAESAQATVASMQSTYDGLSSEVAALVEEQRAAEQAAAAARAAQIVQDSANGALDDSKDNSKEDENNSSSDAADSSNSSDNAASNPSNNAADETPGSSGSSSSPENPTSPYDPSQDVVQPPSYDGGSDVVSRAYAMLGKPYVWGAVGPQGFDCSGLVSYCLAGRNVRLGTTATFINWPRVSNPQPGDIAVVHNETDQHTGIYIGGGQMIHAATYGVGVVIGPVQKGMVIVRQP